jgi:flagella basal body P-ring formation protein FlgA
MMPMAVLAAAACIAVSPESDRISASDLTLSFPAFAAVPGDTPVALAPAPGVRRIFSIPELRRLAARWGVAGDPEREVCVERRTAPLEASRLLEAMQRQFPEADIEMVDYSRINAPDGVLEFPPGGLRESGDAAIWPGYVRYAGTRRFLVWAKVRIHVRIRRLVAAEDLPAGLAVSASQVRVEERLGFPDRTPYASETGEADGRILSRPVKAGQPILRAWLTPAKDVERGDTVRVEVRSGSARLEVECRAESSGSTGERISVRNPASQKQFRARVTGKGKAIVEGSTS